MNIAAQSIIHKIHLQHNENSFYIKRDDLLPFSFGGNKARKVKYFFEEILSGDYGAVITYGSGSSNHCRVVANMAASNGKKCYIVSPEEEYHETFNSLMVKKFGASIIKTPLNNVSETIDNLFSELSSEKPYFIPGGGHGNLGTQAYVDAYYEICDFEKQNNIYFDYIFHACGTGTTQAGLVCGAALNDDKNRNIIGISIARANPRCKQVVENSVTDYLSSVQYSKQYPSVVVDDSYISGGYAKYNKEIVSCVNDLLIENGIPLNTTYTGKAFWGMKEYISKNDIRCKNVLFLHTGGCPLFFDDFEGIK